MLFLRQTHSHACSRGMCLLVRICVGLNARARFARKRESARARMCVYARKRMGPVWVCVCVCVFVCNREGEKALKKPFRVCGVSVDIPISTFTRPLVRWQSSQAQNPRTAA